MNINHLSVSRTQLWDECKQKYKFKYHLEIKSLEPEPPYFAYGKVVHKAIEEFIKAKGTIDIHAILKQILNGEILVEPNQQGKPNIPADYLARLPAEMHAFMQLTHQIGTEGICEWAFNYDLDPPHNKMLYGLIDRLIIKDNKIFILDYKTTRKSKWRKDSRTIAGDLQLRTYAMVASDFYKIDAKDIKCSLFYLEGAEICAAKFTQETLNNTRQYLLNVYNSIVAAAPDEVIGNVGSHCSRCDFKKVCPWVR